MKLGLRDSLHRLASDARRKLLFTIGVMLAASALALVFTSRVTPPVSPDPGGMSKEYPGFQTKSEVWQSAEEKSDSSHIDIRTAAPREEHRIRRAKVEGYGTISEGASDSQARSSDHRQAWEAESAPWSGGVSMIYQISDTGFQERFPTVPLEVMDSVRHDFEKQAGVGELAASDPEYARRWKIAEPNALERMRTLFGWAAVAEFQRKAAMQASEK